jgi:glutamate-1-semialdehyde 2,1-aminomutase/spore coat polysaccharide biosynthesis protein SpsF
VEKAQTVAIVQARMGSSRCPGKVLADIAGRPLLWHVVGRARRIRAVDQVVVATTIEPADDAIAAFCAEYEIAVFRGSESDVLDRYYQAAKSFAAETIVRVTADCPVLDPEVVDRVMDVYRAGGYDYVTNGLVFTYPDGLEVEVFSFAALEKTWREARKPGDREHVSMYMQTSGLFRVENVENEADLSPRNLRWTVDEPEDLAFIRAVYERLWSERRPFFGLADILKLLDEEPELQAINGGFIRNEGYYKTLAQEPPLPPHERSLKISHELKRKAEALIPSCTQTFSKGPTQFTQGTAPVFLARGKGSRVWDVDGNEYIDYPMALGPIILGHDYPAVSAAVTRQMRDGTTFSLPHPLEIEVAELLVESIPCAEKVRFGKNGSDATAGAVRAARAYTGRDVIACSGYHGWQDWFIGTTTRNRGVPRAVRRLTQPFEYNRIETLERIFAEYPGQVAAVIMEPIGVALPRDGFLQKVQQLARREGALLIFDEVVTGFRLALGGAQDFLKVTPDLACFGKALANGYPLSAIVGRRDVMDLFDEVFFSFTFGGEALSLAAAKATIAEMREKNVIAHLWEQGRRLKDGYNTLAKQFAVADITECVGLPPRSAAVFRDKTGAESLLLKSIFQQECLKRGVLFSGGHNLCFSHSLGDVDHTLRVYRAAMEILRQAAESGDPSRFLEGKPVEPVFRAM